MKIIVQAGGLGTRMQKLTTNKPKGLISVKELPILFHLFQKYPNEQFVIIGDYQFEVLDKYLTTFAKNTDYLLLKAQTKGNAAGIKQALDYIHENEPFMIIWSDIILAKNFQISDIKQGCQVGVVDFDCSWSLKDGALVHERIDGKGVAGLYVFDNKSYFDDFPEGGSFTDWLANKGIPLYPLKLDKSIDIGTIEAYHQANTCANHRCRPYNKIEFNNGKVTKTGITPEGQKLIDREVVWYNKVREYGFEAIPEIYSTKPLVMEDIKGINVFLAQLSDEEKKATIDRLIAALSTLHSFDSAPASAWDVYKEYFQKTIDRLQSIAPALPFASDKRIEINGKSCLNVLVQSDLLRQAVLDNLEVGQYVPIHGDCTLTNTLINNEGKIFFIDARGYFGKSIVLGDAYYDWVKLFYSINGNFDQFNIKHFEFLLGDKEICYKINSGGWEHLTDYFLSQLHGVELSKIKLIHAIVWLSLASHAWEDFDSMCVAFYNGTFLFNEWLEAYGHG